MVVISVDITIIAFADWTVRRFRYWPLQFLATLLWVALAGLICSSAMGQEDLQSRQSDSSRPNSLPRKIPSEHVPNLVQVHRDVYSGGQPEGEVAFQELHSMGVQTIISVDGVTPDVANAELHHMRYVHLPHGYDGISDSRVMELAKAVRDLPKPIYIHCHLGRHRSPSAASAACVTAGLISETDARAVLEIAGTGKNYIGLFATVDRAKYDSARDWAKIQTDFQPIASIPPIARSMVSIEHYWSRIQTAMNSESVKDVPRSKDTEHDRLMLRELYVELNRDERAIKDIAFSKYLTDAVAIIDSLNFQDKEAMKLLEQNCKACHQIYRDVPNSANR